ncbi:uncharacterized protein AMSG_07956 [Thecamonas trahens ATCC 50062]|uniref:Uncharacterized protein n=1 Tax=Thecamonas trahens ATCC 50062 TaxID=461836 RepID=A0A0L0DKG8_THETB|nr:hypothetical protein AMSG_07956 [Thecamonas trahens ATCC 50062]KNC51863.1 hypothetical protein AMSG_07956 [Thecamonas trahens ATCC 50062]|eukprot:XP_013755724.1 hypothetical protein AMSG_07956 [Thecamonas trahens ATCC 50062]
MDDTSGYKRPPIKANHAISVPGSTDARRGSGASVSVARQSPELDRRTTPTRSMSPARQRVSPSMNELSTILGVARTSGGTARIGRRPSPREVGSFTSSAYHSDLYSSLPHSSAAHQKPRPGTAPYPRHSSAKTKGVGALATGVKSSGASSVVSSSTGTPNPSATSPDDDVGSAFSAPEPVALGLDPPSAARMRPTLLSRTAATSPGAAGRTSSRATYPSSSAGGSLVAESVSRQSAAAGGSNSPYGDMRSPRSPLPASMAMASPRTSTSASASATATAVMAPSTPTTVTAAVGPGAISSARSDGAPTALMQTLLAATPSALAADCTEEQLDLIISKLRAAREITASQRMSGTEGSPVLVTSPVAISAVPVSPVPDVRASVVDSYEGPSSSSTTSNLGLASTARFLKEQLDRFEEEIARARLTSAGVARAEPMRHTRPVAPEPEARGGEPISSMGELYNSYSQLSTSPSRNGTYAFRSRPSKDSATARSGIEIVQAPAQQVTRHTAPNPSRMYDLLSPRSQNSPRSAFSTPTSRQSSGRASPAQPRQSAAVN